MPSLVGLTVVATPLMALLGGVVYPKLQFAGAFRKVDKHLPASCTKLPGLEACEDAWVHADSGLAYLACSSIKTRKSWLPTMQHLDAEAAPQESTDYLALYNFETGTHSKLKITGLPSEAHGVWLHGIDAWVHTDDPQRVTIAINSHRPLKDRSLAKSQGANSVIELFDTRLGDKELKYVTTIEHDLVRTPNSLAMVGPRQVYLTNDHRRKVHWSRHFEILYPEPSDIVFCDASKKIDQCSVAVDGVIYPNGLAKGPGNMIYSVSSMDGYARFWERQADNTLVLVDEIKLGQSCDNLHVGPDGAIYIASFPNALDFIVDTKDFTKAKAATEVFRITNKTGESTFYGDKWNVQSIVRDDGSELTGLTTAAPYKNKLLLTGVGTKAAHVCEMSY